MLKKNKKSLSVSPSDLADVHDNLGEILEQLELNKIRPDKPEASLLMMLAGQNLMMISILLDIKLELKKKKT